MEDTAKMESHPSSAAAFVEGGVQDACDDACSICLEDFCNSDPSTVTACKHEFHLQCILEWCQRSSQCPMCWQSISLKNPTSQELLEAVEQERNIRVNRSHNATIFHHPMLGDFELQHLPVGVDDGELQERIIQHLAAASMGRAHHLVRREASRGRSASQGRPQFLVYSRQPSAPSIGPVPASSAHREENEPAPAFTAAIPSIPLAVAEEEPIRHAEASTGQADQVANLPSRNSVATANSPRIFAGQSTLLSQERAGPSDFHSFSESLKSRLSAVSMRYKESITKSTRGWKERLFSRSNSIADLGSEVRREVNAGIATVSRMIERLDTRDNVEASGASASNSAQTHSVTETSDGRAIGSHINTLHNDTNISASCATNSDMRQPDHAVRRAAAKKRKATDDAEGSRRRPRSRSPTRSPTRSTTPTPSTHRPREDREPVPAVDLTADTSPEERRAERNPPAEPSSQRAEMTITGAEQALAGGSPMGEQVRESLTAAGPPVEGPSALDAAPTSSDPAGIAKGVGADAVPSRPSLMNQGRRAEQLMARVCLPEFQGELHRQGASFHDVFVAQLWTVNSIASMRDVLVQSETVLRQTRRELVEAQVRAERAEGALGAARVERAEELEEAKRQAAAELERARVANEMLDAARATISAQDLRIDSYTLEVKAAKLRATMAEESARVAEARAAEMEAATRAAEEGAVAAEERAARAVDDFRRSAAFEDELAEASTGAYHLGFQDGKEKVGRIFGLTGFDDIEPNEVPDEAAVPPRQADDGSAPTEA